VGVQSYAKRILTCSFLRKRVEKKKLSNKNNFTKFIGLLENILFITLKALIKEKTCFLLNFIQTITSNQKQTNK
jgi:hypothetical protein